MVRPLEAELTHDVDWLSKMDPFVVLIIGGQKHKTLVAKSGGKHPKWTDILTLNRTSEDIVYVEVWDHESLESDKLVGMGELNISNVVMSGPNQIVEWVPLFYQQKPAGKILLEMSFQSSGFSVGGAGIGAGYGISSMGVQQTQFVEQIPGGEIIVTETQQQGEHHHHPHHHKEEGW